MTIDDSEVRALIELRDKLARRLADLDRRIAARHGLSFETKPSGSAGGFSRQTRLAKWRIHCAICDRRDALATRYPGGEPSVCDDCLKQFTDPQAARNGSKKSDREREKQGRPPREAARRIE